MKIALMGDLHYGSTFENIDQTDIKDIREKYFEQFTKNLFSQEADLYLSAGDLTNLGAPAEFEGIYKFINQYDREFYQVLGNHDLYLSDREEAKQYISYVEGQILSFPEVDIFMLETARVKDPENYGGFISDEQLEQLENFLKQSEDKPVMVLGHHPVYDTTFGSNVDMWSIDADSKIIDVLKTKTEGPAFYVCGHNHADNIISEDNWQFIQLGAVLDYTSTRIFEITDEFCAIKDVPFETEETREWADTIATHMTHFNLWTEAVGTRLQKNQTFYK